MAKAQLVKGPAPSTTDYSMPEESAKIRGKHGSEHLLSFLLSPTEYEMSLNLTKEGRKQVHRLIDGYLGYGKLSHFSLGIGRARCMRITKSCMIGPDQIAKTQALHKSLQNVVEQIDKNIEVDVYDFTLD